VDSGLDHVQITLESYDPKVHDKITGVEGSWEETLQGLKNAIASPIYRQAFSSPKFTRLDLTKQYSTLWIPGEI